MGEYATPTFRFPCRGVNLRAPLDQLPPGKYSRLENVRPYIDQAVQTRVGLTRVSQQLSENVIHSIFRLNDPTEFGVANPWIRVVGAGTKVFGGTVPATFTVLATGFSGNPVGLVGVLPDGQLQPWCYIVDTEKMVKTRADKTVYGIGLPPPVAPPTAALEAPDIEVVELMDTAFAGWTPLGTYAGAITEDHRVNTVAIDKILYDTGTTGWASVVLADMKNINAGMYLGFGVFPANEVTFVQSVKPPLTDTTIESIKYDAGATGLCTIQPAYMAVGALDSPVAGSSATRTSAQRRASNIVPPAIFDDEQRQRIVDLAVDAYIEIDGEGVRILSVTVGPDGIQSFRCSTTVNHAAGEAIAGFASVRVYLTQTWVVTDTVDNQALTNTITPPSPAPAAMFGGITRVNAVDLSTINGRPTQPDDEFHISMKFSTLQNITEIRVMFDVDQTTNDFTQNYYFFAFRPTDLVAALQETNAGDVVSVISARTTAVSRAQTNRRTGGSGGVGGAGGGLPPGTVVGNAVRRGPGNPIGGSGGGRTSPRTSPRTGRPINPTGVSGGDPSGGAVGTTQGGAVSGQFGGGINQWIEIRFRVSELSRVGSDQTRTLKDVQATQVLVSCGGADPIQLWYNSLTLGGSKGPDVGSIGDPYIYCYRALSTITGAKSNPSPAMRSGVSPRRQGVLVTGTQHPSPECDRIEWYRSGGGLPTWASVAITKNDNPPVLTDRYPDDVILTNGGIEDDNFQPWPVTDSPKTGTVDVAGTAVTWVSGDKFNTSWAPGTLIVISGQVYTLYAQPASDTFLEVLENVGTITGGEYTIQDATIMGQPLPSMWGPFDNTFFACDDPRNPGLLYWSKGNNPECASDADNLQVTAPSERLLNGCVADRRNFVMSDTDMYEIFISSSGVTRYQSEKTACGRGLFTRRGIATDGVNIYFIAEDGVYVSQAGSFAQSITDEDLYPLFPHDGVAGVETNGFKPPDPARASEWKLAYAHGFLYFDYVDTAGAYRTLVFDPDVRGWFPDVYTGGVASHAEEAGDGVYTTLAGGTNGYLNINAGTQDAGADIASRLRTIAQCFDDPRLEKWVGDVMLDADAKGGAGFTAALGFNLFTDIQPGVVVAAGYPSRKQTSLEVVGGGRFARDLGVDISWGSSPVALPALFAWQPSVIGKAPSTGRRPTDYDDAGYSGAKFVQGVIIRANTGGVARQVQVEYDGGQLGPVLTINHNGEIEKPYPTAGSPDWTPFVAHLVRLLPIDSDSWTFLGARWVYEKSPELASFWQTPVMTHEMTGFFVFRPYALIGYQSTAQVTFAVIVDGRTFTYVLPSTAGAYAKTWVPMQVMKGKSVQYSVSSAPGVRLYQQDLELGVKQWGETGPWRIVRPFGDTSAEGAARI